MKRLLLIVLLLKGSTFFAQSDSISNAFNKKRFYLVSGSMAALWSGSMIGLSQVWYKEVPRTSFHSFDDSRNWLQMDKMGHFYTANKISSISSDLFQWSGIPRKKAAMIGAGVGFGYQLNLEFFDAFSQDWGFSWSDVGANFAGSALYLGQQLLWEDERVLLKFSSHLSPYAQLRPEVLGTSRAERILKDYNGQTYWISVSPGAFIDHRLLPPWLCLSAGYSVDAKLVGDKEVFTINNVNYYSARQYLFSLDIDFSKLPVKKPWLKALVKQFNYIKVPFPALIITDGKGRLNSLYF